MSSPSFAEEWGALVERVKASNERLLTEAEACWRDLQRLLERSAHEGEALSRALDEPRDLRAWRRMREEAARRLLHELWAEWERLRLAQRLAMSFEAYERELEAAIEALPEAMPVTASEAIQALDVGELSRRRRWLAALRRSRRPWPVRAIVTAEWRRQHLRHLEAMSRYSLTLAEGLRSLRVAWEAIRAAIDAAAVGRPMTAHERDARLHQVRTLHREVIERGAAILSAWREASEAMGPQLKERLVQSVIWPWRRHPREVGELWTAYRTQWINHTHAAEAEIRLERQWEQAEDRSLRCLQAALESVAFERAALWEELEEAIGWLREQIENRASGELPPPRTDVIAATTRMAELESTLRTEWPILPLAYELQTPFSASLRRRPRMRRLRPREVFARSFQRVAWHEIARLFREVEASHRDLLQQIERAREVVRFGLEAASSTPWTEMPLAQDALQNALSLLEHERRQRSDGDALIGASLLRTVASAFLEARMILTRHRLGVLAYLAQQGLRHALIIIGRSSASVLLHVLRRATDALQRLTFAFLVAIGWKPAPSAPRMEVVAREFLPEEFTVDLEAKALPALYRYLFRLEPVQDPRFLVGRDQELATIAAARALWEAGRPVAILIVGQRGSGKTSLLNGAAKRSLAGLEIVRGEFRDRLTTELQMRDFLARVVGADEATRLEEWLAASRRVVILEELERTFLRHVGGYGAIRELQRVIAATCSSTLWILTLNEVAFRFLNAVVNLGASFSHRLNISAAGRAELREAILRRHALSGLRVQFPPPPQSHALADRLRAFLQGPADPEALFFEALARESAGIYRTALELWLGHVEAIEAGVLYLKPIATPDLSRVIEDLDLDDVFTLVAILQHGSLTPEEHALVFQRSISASRAQLDELLARELIEPDPDRPGLRVRPEASRVVRDALYRRNLL